MVGTKADPPGTVCNDNFRSNIIAKLLRNFVTNNGLIQVVKTFS